MNDKKSMSIMKKKGWFLYSFEIFTSLLIFILSLFISPYTVKDKLLWITLTNKDDYFIDDENPNLNYEYLTTINFYVAYSYVILVFLLIKAGIAYTEYFELFKSGEKRNPYETSIITTIHLSYMAGTMVILSLILSNTDSPPSTTNLYFFTCLYTLLCSYPILYPSVISFYHPITTITTSGHAIKCEDCGYMIRSIFFIL